MWQLNKTPCFPEGSYKLALNFADEVFQWHNAISASSVSAQLTTTGRCCWLPLCPRAKTPRGCKRLSPLTAAPDSSSWLQFKNEEENVIIWWYIYIYIYKKKNKKIQHLLFLVPNMQTYCVTFILMINLSFEFWVLKMSRLDILTTPQSEERTWKVREGSPN